MKCWNCGAELGDGASFCSQCGRSQPQGGNNPGWNNGGPTPPPPGSGGGNNAIILTIFAIVCMAVYAWQAIVRVFGLIGRLFYLFSSFSGLIYLIANLLMLVGGVFLCLVLLMIAFRRTPANSNGLILCLAGGGLVNLAGRLLLLLNTLIFVRYPSAIITSFKALMSTGLGAVITVGGVYVIIRFVLGESPLSSFDSSALADDLRQAFSSASQAAGEVGARASQAAQDAQARRTAPPPQQNQWPTGPVPPYPSVRLRTDRSLLFYILLSLVTCGLYGWYFIYSLAQDTNVVCSGDGRNTPGLLKFILLSFITCGFYQLYWMYCLGNRLAECAPRYGFHFQENGTTILLWHLVGALLCGIGPLIAMHIIIKNMNTLCGAYNHRNGF